jgi:hypothetical protein
VREADRLACSVSSPFSVLEDEEDEDEEPEGGFVVAFASCLLSFVRTKLRTVALPLLLDN